MSVDSQTFISAHRQHQPLLTTTRNIPAHCLVQCSGQYFNVQCFNVECKEVQCSAKQRAMWSNCSAFIFGFLLSGGSLVSCTCTQSASLSAVQESREGSGLSDLKRSASRSPPHWPPLLVWPFMLVLTPRPESSGAGGATLQAEPNTYSS